MDRTIQCGYGSSGNCFIVGVRDLEHTKTLGAHDVLFYVVKRMLSAYLVARRIYPTGERERAGVEVETDSQWTPARTADVMAPYDADMHLNTKDQTKEGRKSYPVGDPDPRAWVAPELTREEACPDWRGRKYIVCFTESTDIYAMGYVLWDLCGDFFSDMTPREISAYGDEMFAKGFPTKASLPHVVHGLRLRKALDRTMTVTIANRINHRRIAAYWATFFQEQLMVDPLVCRRPPEMKPLQKKHPDGPTDIVKDKL
ncbi:hypothetical protein R1sor_013616 [Riccia sorocarpa]|uniref:Protein kinase domain-containing protein n=1 Tax=Riccia sorocarpa TaxID=122646 RepID=A0ABD3H9P7_9MARC